MTVSEQDLIIKIIQGNQDLYQDILEIYERQVFVYLLRLLNFHQEDAEDITSQTFVKAYINLAEYNSKLKFSSWLYRIAHNEAVNLIRKKSKQFTSDIDNYTASVVIDFDKPKKSDLEKVLNHLRISEKNLLVLFYLEEKSIREISNILKITESNVKTKLSRARKKARKLAN